MFIFFSFFLFSNYKLLLYVCVCVSEYACVIVGKLTNQQINKSKKKKPKIGNFGNLKKKARKGGKVPDIQIKKFPRT